MPVYGRLRRRLGLISHKVYRWRLTNARLKKDDQLPGDVPFVMSGVTNAGVVDYISNPVRTFPENSLTIDIFGHVFYRDYEYGGGDDVGAYWRENDLFDRYTMQYIQTVIGKAIAGRFSYSKKLRSSQSLDIEIALPVTEDGKPDVDFMTKYIKVIEKLTVQEVRQELDDRLEAYKKVTLK